MFEPVLTENIHRPDSEKISTYLAHGGYEATRQALTKHTPDELIDMVKRSGLRGRGGAGFPAGVKWGFMPKDAHVQKIVAVNTDEGEPGTFKDRQIVECDPHQIIEGVIIASYAVGANRANVYIRGEFFLGVKRWIKAIADAYEHGFLGKNILNSGFDLDMSVHRGAGAYICGEETAMIESLEGKPGNPRLKPPYPAQIGLFGLCRPWSTISRRWPASSTSCYAAPSGSPASEQRRAKGRRFFRSAGTSIALEIMSCPWGLRWKKSFSNMGAACAAADH